MNMSTNLYGFLCGYICLSVLIVMTCVCPVETGRHVTNELIFGISEQCCNEQNKTIYDIHCKVVPRYLIETRMTIDSQWMIRVIEIEMEC